MATKITSAQKMEFAREQVISEYFGKLLENSIGQTGPSSYDMVIPLDSLDGTVAGEEVFVTVKVSAHKPEGTSKSEPYDGFQAVEDWKAEVADRKDKAEARKAERERKERVKAEKAEARSRAKAAKAAKAEAETNE